MGKTYNTFFKINFIGTFPIINIIKGYNTVHVIFITVNCFIDSIFIT